MTDSDAEVHSQDSPVGGSNYSLESLRNLATQIDDEFQAAMTSLAISGRPEVARHQGALETIVKFCTAWRSSRCRDSLSLIRDLEDLTGQLVEQLVKSFGASGSPCKGASKQSRELAMINCFLLVLKGRLRHPISRRRS